MSDEVRWFIIGCIVYFAGLMVQAWVISFAIRSALRNAAGEVAELP